MEHKKWNYKGFEIEESLKPGVKKLQYFFRIEEKGTKKCTLCVWIEEATPDKFEDIINSEKESWITWVKEKIDQGILNNLALKIGESGKEEIKLSEISEKVDF
jgi:hypothetical protein